MRCAECHGPVPPAIRLKKSEQESAVSPPVGVQCLPIPDLYLLSISIANREYYLIVCSILVCSLLSSDSLKYFQSEVSLGIRLPPGRLWRSRVTNPPNVPM